MGFTFAFNFTKWLHVTEILEELEGLYEAVMVL